MYNIQGVASKIRPWSRSNGLAFDEKADLLEVLIIFSFESWEIV